MKSWLRLPTAVLQDDRLTRSACMIYAVIIDRADFGPVELSQAELAACAGCSRRSVQRALQLLEDTGYIAARCATGRADVIIPRAIIAPKRRRAARSGDPGRLGELAAANGYLDTDIISQEV